MLPELLPTAQAYALGDAFLTALVGDFTDADWQVKDAAGHGAIWIVGHLTALRHRVLTLAGLPPEPATWEAFFGRGTSPADVPADLDPRELVRAFHAAQEALVVGWDAVSAESLAKPLGRTLPDGSDTCGGALRFLAWHEAYHLGQLGLLRRLAGKPGRA